MRKISRPQRTNAAKEKMSVADFLDTLDEQQLVEVRDKNNNIEFRGKAGFSPIVYPALVEYTEAESGIDIDGKPYTLITIYTKKPAHANSSTKVNAAKLTGSNLRDLVTRILREVDSDVKSNGGASLAAIGTNDDFETEEELNILVMLVMALDKYDVYRTNNGYFNDIDFIVVSKGKKVEDAFKGLEMAVPDDLTKV